VGGLKLNERLIALIVTWMLTPRGRNHSVLSEEDLVYMYCIMNKVKINWIHIIKEHMQKSMRLSDKQPTVSTIQPVVFPFAWKNAFFLLKLIDQALGRN